MKPLSPVVSWFLTFLPAFLELSINQMTGVIPSSIQQLTALEYFAMAYNELSGSMPTVLGRMTSLQFLNLKSSQIQGTIPTEIGQLASLGKFIRTVFHRKVLHTLVGMLTPNSGIVCPCSCLDAPYRNTPPGGKFVNRIHSLFPWKSAQGG